MIKITFKEPQLTEDGVLCMFALGYYVSYNNILNETYLYNGEEWLGNIERCTFQNPNIQSIEHVKPTDL